MLNIFNILKISLKNEDCNFNQIGHSQQNFMLEN